MQVEFPPSIIRAAEYLVDQKVTKTSVVLDVAFISGGAAGVVGFDLLSDFRVKKSVRLTSILVFVYGDTAGVIDLNLNGAISFVNVQPLLPVGEFTYTLLNGTTNNPGQPGLSWTNGQKIDLTDCNFIIDNSMNPTINLLINGPFSGATAFNGTVILNFEQVL